MARETDAVTAAIERTVASRTAQGRQLTRSWEGELHDTCDFLVDLDSSTLAWRCRRSDHEASGPQQLVHTVDQRRWEWDAAAGRWEPDHAWPGLAESPLAGWMFLLGVDRVHERTRLSTGHERLEVGVSVARAAKAVRRANRTGLLARAEREGFTGRLTMWVTIGVEGTLDQLEYSGGEPGNMVTRQCWLHRLGASQPLPKRPEDLDLRALQRLR